MRRLALCTRAAVTRYVTDYTRPPSDVRSLEDHEARNGLVTALFCDLSPDKRLTIPKNTELRDRALADLVRKRRKPIVLIVDEAHDLRQETLISLKRLIEAAAEGEGKLSVLLAGHPKLRRDLRSPTMEEIGYRTTVSRLRA